MKTILIATAVAVAVATAAHAQSVNCPIDNYIMYFTGQTRTEMGKMLFQYKCPQGHTTWVVQ